MGKPSGSAMKVKRFFVISSILTGSAVMSLKESNATVFSMSSTSNAKCCKPQASGFEVRAGGSEKKKVR